MMIASSARSSAGGGRDPTRRLAGGSFDHGSLIADGSLVEDGPGERPRCSAAPAGPGTSSNWTLAPEAVLEPCSRGPAPGGPFAPRAGPMMIPAATTTTTASPVFIGRIDGPRVRRCTSRPSSAPRDECSARPFAILGRHGASVATARAMMIGGVLRGARPRVRRIECDGRAR